jgi:Cadherin domain.
MTVDAGGDNDTFYGNSSDNILVLTGINQGTLDGITFSNIENIDLLSGNNTVYIRPGGQLTGTLNGGTSTFDLPDGVDVPAPGTGGGTGGGGGDHTAPAAPSIPDLIAASDSGNSDTDNLTSDTTPTVTGTAEAGSTVELFADGSSLGSTTADSSGNWSFTVPAAAALSDGSSAITASATDLAGNTSASSPALTITIDTTAPTFTSSGTAAAIDENNGAGQLIYTAAATDDSSVSYSLKGDNNDDAAAFSMDSLTGEVTLTADPDYESQSAYSFTVVATDAAGQQQQSAAENQCG